MQEVMIAYKITYKDDYHHYHNRIIVYPSLIIRNNVI